jgi:hypothetical protein
MNFSPKTKAWILLASLIISGGGAVMLASHEGGASIGWAIVAGLIAGCTNVYHALSDSPKDKSTTENKQP